MPALAAAKSLNLLQNQADLLFNSFQLCKFCFLYVIYGQGFDSQADTLEMIWVQSQRYRKCLKSSAASPAFVGVILEFTNDGLRNSGALG